MEQTEEQRAADEELQAAWRESMRARVVLIETQIDHMQRQLDALRESLRGVVEP